MKHEAVFEIQTPDAEILASSIIPESDSSPGGRSMGRCILLSSDSLRVEIGAEDLTALRAALNSWLRLIQIADEIVRTTKKPGETKE